jgi:hypothetical protein
MKDFDSKALAALDAAARHRRLDSAFEELRDTMIRSFRTIWRDRASHSRPGCSEAERRETAVQEIKEFMAFRPFPLRPLTGWLASSGPGILECLRFEL